MKNYLFTDMNRKKAKKFLLDYPELYKMIYGPIPEKKKKFSLPKKNDIIKVLTYLFVKPAKYLFIHPVNTVINNISYNSNIRRAKRLYKKTNIHRHVMPIKPKKLGIIVGADLVSYNKKALKYGMKRFKYKTLKKESYFSTDTLSLAKNHHEKIQLIPIISD